MPRRTDTIARASSRVSAATTQTRVPHVQYQRETRTCSAGGDFATVAGQTFGRLANRTSRTSGPYFLRAARRAFDAVA